jgi:hypothetical protein
MEGRGGGHFEAGLMALTKLKIWIWIHRKGNVGRGGKHEPYLFIPELCSEQKPSQDFIKRKISWE